MSIHSLWLGWQIQICASQCFLSAERPKPTVTRYTSFMQRSIRYSTVPRVFHGSTSMTKPQGEKRKSMTRRRLSLLIPDATLPEHFPVFAHRSNSIVPESSHFCYFSPVDPPVSHFACLGLYAFALRPPRPISSGG